MAPSDADAKKTTIYDLDLAELESLGGGGSGKRGPCRDIVWPTGLPTRGPSGGGYTGGQTSSPDHRLDAARHPRAVHIGVGLLDGLRGMSVGRGGRDGEAAPPHHLAP